MRRALLAICVSAATACAHAQPSGEMDRSGFVDAAGAVPGLVVDMRYFGEENFVGRRIVGYEAPVCLLTQEAVTALARVQARVGSSGLG